MSLHPRHPRGRRFLYRALLPTLLCLSGTLLRAQTSPSFTLEVLPENIELQSCQTPTPLFIVARNTGKQSIATLTLDPTTDPKITLTPDKPVPTGPLQKGDQRRWSYRLTCASAFTPTTLIFTATGRGSKRTSSLSQILLKSIPIKLRPPDALDSIATVDIKSNLETLTSASLGDLLVAVTNKTTQPIPVKAWPAYSSSVQFNLPGTETEAEEKNAVERSIAGGGTYTFRFSVKARERVNPGKQLLEVNVHLQTDPPRQFLVTQEVTVGVLGESEALKLLGVPSLLFLPGFLVMTSFMMLWRANILRPVGDAAALSLTEKDPGYWVISILLSAVILGGFVLHRRDFLLLYGLEDVAWVWLVSIVLGAGGYIAMRLVLNIRDRRKFPQEDDPPLEILRKLSFWKVWMGRPLVVLKDSPHPAFLLGKRPDGSIYICPQIILTWHDNADPAVRARVEEQLIRNGDPIIVARAIEQQNTLRPPQLSGIKSLAWDTTDPNCDTPKKIARDLYVSITDNIGILLSSVDDPDT